jgi:TolB protein
LRITGTYPKLSPDGKLLAFVSLEDEKVVLRVLNTEDNKAHVLAKLVGSNGVMDAPSWSPDSKRLVFVSYQFLP